MSSKNLMLVVLLIAMIIAIYFYENSSKKKEEIAKAASLDPTVNMSNVDKILYAIQKFPVSGTLGILGGGTGFYTSPICNQLYQWQQADSSGSRDWYHKLNGGEIGELQQRTGCGWNHPSFEYLSI